MKTKNIELKRMILKDIYNEVDQEQSFNDWLQGELDNDPYMGQFLTEDDYSEELPDDIDELFDKEDVHIPERITEYDFWLIFEDAEGNELTRHKHQFYSEQHAQKHADKLLANSMINDLHYIRTIKA